MLQLPTPQLIFTYPTNHPLHQLLSPNPKDTTYTH
ncbi:hypothetical protein CP01DC11_1379, partial [Chlamydia psittaci 01DC11]